MRTVTVAEYDELVARQAKRSKYHARPVVLPDGTRFDSERECERWGELQLQEAAGTIRNLRRQVRYQLHALGGVEITVYVADFVYSEMDDRGWWSTVVEDAKGVRTPMYRLKAKWMRAQYGIEIRES